jgi:tellurite resistance protein
MSKEYSKKVIKSKVNIAKDIVQSLTEVADTDGKMTDDEIGLIMNIKRNLDNYFAIIQEYDDTDVLTRSEEMHIIEKKLIQDATAKAFEDGKITDDEKQLLRKLAELMESIAQSK